ncbi:MAG: hypothetical protein IKZ19_06210, partial [Clostridia bacterium]|nr:hypothetical protein [Clostridia bacterium]
KMEELDLYGTVDAVFSCLDSVNHLSNTDALNKSFGRTGLFLEQGGVFIFDVITRRRMERLNGQAYIREADGIFCSYRYNFDKKNSSHRIDLDIFTADRRGLYRRESESIYEKAFSLEELDYALALGGMDRVGLHGEFAMRKAKDSDERITVVARRNNKSTHDISKDLSESR